MVEIKKKYLDRFINGINKDFKWDFDPFYLDSKYDMDGFSFLYFHNYIIKRSNKVIDEIKENLLLISVEKHLFYLNYVEDRIKRDVVSNVDSMFLNKWIEKYDTSNLEFPFIQNPDLKMILSKNIDEFKGFVPLEDQVTIEIQKDFHLYAYYLEKNKIINFIKSLLVERGFKAIQETQGIEDKKVFVPGEETVVDFEANAKPKKLETASQSGLNDYTKSTIEDCLFDIKNDINPDQYEILVDTLYSFFSTGEFPELENKIMFKSVNKKKVGWALKEAYMNLKTGKLSLEYLKFAKDNINLFENEKIESKNFRKSNFYKYFTTKP